MPATQTEIRDAVEKTTRLAAAMVKDAADDGAHAARRAARWARRRAERLEDFADGTARYVKRQPLTAMALVAASGLALGVLFGWRAGRRRADVRK